MRNLCQFLLPVFSQLTWRSQSKTLKFTGHDCSVWQRNISEFMASMAAKKSIELQLQFPHLISFTARNSSTLPFQNFDRLKAEANTTHSQPRPERWDCMVWLPSVEALKPKFPLELQTVWYLYTSRNVWTFMHSLVLRQAHVIDSKVRRKNTIKYPHES